MHTVFTQRAVVKRRRRLSTASQQIKWIKSASDAHWILERTCHPASMELLSPKEPIDFATKSKQCRDASHSANFMSGSQWKRVSHKFSVSLRPHPCVYEIVTNIMEQGVRRERIRPPLHFANFDIRGCNTLNFPSKVFTELSFGRHSKHRSCKCYMAISVKRPLLSDKNMAMQHTASYYLHNRCGLRNAS